MVLLHAHAREEGLHLTLAPIGAALGPLHCYAAAIGAAGNSHRDKGPPQCVEDRPMLTDLHARGRAFMPIYALIRGTAGTR